MKRCFQISRGYIDLTNKKFGMLKVIGLDHVKNNRYYWMCICDCGNEKVARGDLLKNNTITDCGCVFKNKDTSYRENYVGKKFGNLTVLNETMSRYENGRLKYTYDCICDCGNIVKNVSRQRLKDKKVYMCSSCKNQNIYDLTSEEYGIGYCTNGGYFYFDKEDFQKIKPYTWYKTSKGYIRTHIDETHSLFMHNLVYGKKDLIDIDHANRCKYDNRKFNLRQSTRGENVINRDPITTNISGVTGVGYIERCNKWQARIMKDNKNYHLGLFDNFDDAVDARRKAENDMFGEYAYLKENE